MFAFLKSAVAGPARLLFSARRAATVAGCGAGVALLAAGCAKDSNKPNPLAQEALRQKATGFYQALYSSAQGSVDGYVAPTYTEHQGSADFTLAGLKAYAQTRVAALEARPLIIHRTLVQDHLVGLHVEEPVAPDSSVARMVLLRFDNNGRITDHWEAMQGQPRRRANPHTMFDGAAVNYQSTAGVRGRDAATEADQRAFNTYDTLIVRQSRTRGYIQHNPTLRDGAAGLISLVVFLKNSGLTIVRSSYQRLAEGDFIMTLSGTQATAPGAPTSNDTVVFDLTRLDETGKIAEHWDALEATQPADKAKVFGQ